MPPAGRVSFTVTRAGPFVVAFAASLPIMKRYWFMAWPDAVSTRFPATAFDFEFDDRAGGGIEANASSRHSRGPAPSRERAVPAGAAASPRTTR